jgi:uncharacterized protein (DUF983 family)
LREGRSATPPSPYRSGLLCRCPRCGEGSLYNGLLTVADTCGTCGCDLRGQDSGDGPAVFVILVLGAIIVALALLTEGAFAPPLWVHAVLWPPLIIAGAFVMLRVFKALLIALQYRHRVAGFGETGRDDRGHG